MSVCVCLYVCVCVCGHRFNEVVKPVSGRVRSKVSHFEPGASDGYPSSFPPIEKGSTFGGTAPRFQESSRVHVGLMEGYTGMV